MSFNELFPAIGTDDAVHLVASLTRRVGPEAQLLKTACGLSGEPRRPDWSSGYGWLGIASTTWPESVTCQRCQS